MKRLIFALVCLSFLGGEASASDDEIMTGAGLVEACGIPDESWISFCNGYVQAAFDTYHRAGLVICVPPGTTRADMAGGVYAGLKASPELGSLPGTEAAARVLKALYPC